MDHRADSTAKLCQGGKGWYVGRGGGIQWMIKLGKNVNL